MSQPTGSSGTYSRRFGIGVVIVVALVVLASTNVYTNLAPNLSAGQQDALLSGLATVVLVLIIGLVFISAIVGRESLTALRSLSKKARRMERGEFDVALPTNRDDELGDISRAMSAMCDAVAAEQEGDNVDAQLREYRDTIDAIANGAHSRRLDEEATSGEVAELAASINELVDQTESERRSPENS